MNETDKEELRGLITGDGAIPTYLWPLIAVIFIIVVSVGVVFLMAQHGIRDGAALLYIPLALIFVLWLFFVWLEMLPGWTVIIGLVFASAIIGWKVYQGRSAPGFYS